MNKNILVKDDTFSRKLLGEILWEAGLIGLQQIELALKDQQDYHNLKIGEIFSLRGWVKEETVNFFVEDWPNILQQEEEYHPIGFYLKKANLLTDEQINFILQQQKINQEKKFGFIAISKGFLKETTFNYFIENIKPIQEKLKLSSCRNTQINDEITYIEKPTEIIENIKPISQKFTLSLTRNKLNNEEITYIEKPTEIIENIQPISEQFKLSLTRNKLNNEEITYIEKPTKIMENINQTLIQKDTIITSKKIVIIPSSKPQLIKCNDIYYSAISIDY